MINSKKNYVKIISILVIVALIILSFQFAFNSNASNYSNINFKNAYLKYHGNYIYNTGGIPILSKITRIYGNVWENFTALRIINKTSMLWLKNATNTAYTNVNSSSQPFYANWTSIVSDKKYSNNLPIFNNTLIQRVKNNETLQISSPIFTVNTLSLLGTFFFPILGKNQGYGINYYKYMSGYNNSIKITLINYSYNYHFTNNIQFNFDSLTFWINENTGIILKIILVWLNSWGPPSQISNITTIFPKLFNLTYLENLIENPNYNYYGEIQTINLISTNIKMNSNTIIWNNIIFYIIIPVLIIISIAITLAYIKKIKNHHFYRNKKI